MAPTSDERREVARKMRDAAANYNNGNILNALIGFCGIEFGGKKTLWKATFTMLADLIDPTCLTTTIRVMRGDENVAGDICCSCESCNGGWHWSKYDAAPRFCPHCGAEVVKVVYDYD